MKYFLRALVLTVIAGGLPAEARAQATPAVDLSRASIEDLMNITVTSAARKEQRVGDVPGAVYVITQDDIRRSGMTTLPDLLRLVPGVQVAQINSSKWAVSVRGFNGMFSNKLLVLVDGRSLYNHLFSGVLWDAEDPMLEDIDRIEVIRGPGAAVWGANAVNGVINILTKNAAATKGALVRIGGGTFEPGQVVLRYGGSFGKTNYRVYSQGTMQGHSRMAAGVSADDDWRRATVGFRGDWIGGPRAFTLEGSVTRARANALWFNFDPAPTPNRPGTVDTPSLMNGGALLGRWTRTRANGASVQIQSVLDVARRDEPVGDYRRTTADVEIQYHAVLRTRHDLVAGMDYRFMHEQFAGRNGYTLSPETSNDDRVSVFAQDELALVPRRLRLTLGARVEHDGLAGWGVQPTARITWDVGEDHQHVWAATSRALRTPSLQERGIRVDFPPVLDAGPLPVHASIFGNPEVRTEELADIEAGYRLDVRSVATFAVAAFRGRYRHLGTSEPGAPSVVFGPEGPSVFAPVRFGSLLGADTRGLEVDAHVTPIRWWRIDASYTAFRLTPRLDAASLDPAAAQYDGDASAGQWQVHSGVSIARRVEVDAALFRVGALRHLGVPAYSRADARLEVPLTAHLTASFVGQNLFSAVHAEFGGTAASLAQTLVPRSARVQLAWRY